MALGDATIAVLYGIFAVMLVTICIQSQQTRVSNDIHEAVMKRYASMPWTYPSARYLADLQLPEDIHRWLTSVFESVTFEEQPVLGSFKDYCSLNYPCDWGEGHCEFDSQCRGNLTCGDRTLAQMGVLANGKYWSRAGLVEYCDYAGTPINLDHSILDCNEDNNHPSNLPYCCVDESGVPIKQIEDVVMEKPPAGNCPGNLPPNVRCCSDPHAGTRGANTSGHPGQGSSRPATVGAFNRIYQIRFSMKRYGVSTDFPEKFKHTDANPSVKLKGSSVLDVFSSDPTVEETTPIHNPITGQHYEYAIPGSFMGGGGYVLWINPDEGKMSFRNHIEELRAAGWFNPQLATFVVDMLLYNGNVDKFGHLTWIFNFDHLGQATYNTGFRAMNLDLFNLKIPEYSIRYGLEFVLILFIAGFIAAEVMKVVEFGVYSHFHNGGAWIDVMSLTLCVTAQISNFVLQGDRTLNEFSFEKLNDPATRTETFVAMENLGIRFEDHSVIVALNLLVVAVRAVMLLAQLQSNLGLIVKVMSIAFYNVVYFLIMFLMVMMGFVFLAYFTFGQKYILMSDPLLAFNEVFAMLLGKPIFDDLLRADGLMAYVFFYLFYILFYLVMKNVFVSILMTGYDTADYELKQTKGKEDINPLKRIINDLRVDVFGPLLKVGMLIWAGVRVVAMPLVACTVDCLGSCLLPLVGCFRSVSGMVHSVVQRREKQRNSGNLAPPGSKPGSDGTKEPARKQKSESVSFECVLMVIFMVNFIMLLQLQTDGAIIFRMRDATLGRSSHIAWISNPPMRRNDFKDVQSMGDVYDWARRAVDLWYSDTHCVGDNSVQQCNNANDGEQLVQKISNWNYGFLNTTFVRATVQKACYVPNPNSRWSSGYPLIVDNDLSCAEQDCTTVQFDNTCLSSGGDNVMERMTGQNFPLVKPGDLGPFRKNGGIAVSLGVTKMEAGNMISALYDADMFTKDTLSMVFDFVTYNGNIDMFVHNSILFSLRTSGKFFVDQQSVSFPLNLVAGGGEYEVSRTIWVVMFSIYVAFVIYYTCLLFRDMRVELQNCLAQGKPAYSFIAAFFSKVWNISDSVSIALSITSIVYIVNYATNSFRWDYKFSTSSVNKYVIPNEMVDQYKMVGNTHPLRPLQDDWFIFSEFERLTLLYNQFSTIAALNSFFISIKVVKYVAEVNSIRVFSGTLHFGRERIMYFTIVIGMMLFGFALFYMNLYGHMVEDFADPVSSFMTLFNWMLGRFDLAVLMMYSPFLTIFFFIFFMTVFYFVAVNMYLATMMNTYSETVGKMDIEEVRRRVEKDRRIRVVEYPDKATLEDDITLAFSGNEVPPEIVVHDLKEDGKAAKFGVVKGHIIFKVNGEREEWRKIAETLEHENKTEDQMLELIMKEGIREDPRDARIRVTFKDIPNKGGSLGKMMGLGAGTDEGEIKVQATVRNFWRTQGAVTFVYQKVLNEERAEELERAGDDDNRSAVSDDDGDLDAGDDDNAQGDRGHASQDTSGTSKSARYKTKKRMDMLLFSRWPEGRRIGHDKKVNERGIDGASMPAFSTPDKTEYEDDLDIDNLREIIENVQVSGEEAWLDCLLTAIEREMADESIVTQVLRTSDMSEISKGDASSDKKSLMTFYEQANKVLGFLEFKARKKYYNCLQTESEARQEMLRKQNDVLHDYVSELEKDFTKVMGSIHSLKAKKNSMLTKLAGILGGDDEFLAAPAGGSAD